MAFWESVNKELKKAVGEVSTVAKTGKQRLKVHNLHKQAEKIFTDLGGLVYDMAKPPYKNPLEDPVAMRLVEEIRKLEEEAALIEETITGRGPETLPSKAPQPIAPPAGTRGVTVKARPAPIKTPPAPKEAPNAASRPDKVEGAKAAGSKDVAKAKAPPRKKPAAGGVKGSPKTLTSDALTQKVADLLNDGVRQKDIVEMLGVVKGTVSKHKKKAQARGLLK